MYNDIVQRCRQSRSKTSGRQTLQFVGTCVPESVGKHQPQIQMNNWCRRRESTGAKGRKRGKNTGTKGHQDKKSAGKHLHRGEQARENTGNKVTKRGKTPAGKHFYNSLQFFFLDGLPQFLFDWVNVIRSLGSIHETLKIQTEKKLSKHDHNSQQL